mmetsp:Transcript_122314/g.191863  ORF Transcript_122314/g.191863 Transcript_122314/m.191863 type:complete len:148 (+) Transcript_122314:148-591(+)
MMPTTEAYLAAVVWSVDAHREEREAATYSAYAQAKKAAPPICTSVCVLQRARCEDDPVLHALLRATLLELQRREVLDPLVSMSQVLDSNRFLATAKHGNLGLWSATRPSTEHGANLRSVVRMPECLIKYRRVTEKPVLKVQPAHCET